MMDNAKRFDLEQSAFYTITVDTMNIEKEAKFISELRLNLLHGGANEK
jgi:hypothetical protein